MHFPVCVSLSGHVWHSRQRVFEAVDQRHWHSITWLPFSLMGCICITERHFWVFLLWFLLNVFTSMHPHTKHNHKHSSYVTRVENVKAVIVYGFSNLPNVWDCKHGWPVWAVIGLISGSIMYFNVAGWQAWLLHNISSVTSLILTAIRSIKGHLSCQCNTLNAWNVNEISFKIKDRRDTSL